VVDKWSWILKNNKVKEKNFQSDGEASRVSSGRLTQLTWLGIIVVNTGIWYSIITNGLGMTLAWLIIISSVVAIVIKVREGMRL
jgi:hypothetical protein